MYRDWSLRALNLDPVVREGPAMRATNEHGYDAGWVGHRSCVCESAIGVCRSAALLRETTSQATRAGLTLVSLRAGGYRPKQAER